MDSTQVGNTCFDVPTSDEELVILKTTNDHNDPLCETIGSKKVHKLSASSSTEQQQQQGRTYINLKNLV